MSRAWNKVESAPPSFIKSSLENNSLLLGNLSITAIGQADDTALVSNNLINLFYILELTKIFCSKYNVALSAEKTKLQVFYNRQTSFSMLLSEATNPIKINGNTEL